MKTITRFISIFTLSIVAALAVAAQTNFASIDGGRIDVEGHSGKVVLLSVGAAWLPLSIKQAEYTNALAKKFAGKDVVVYFVATDPTRSGAKNFKSDADLKAFGMTNRLIVPILRDSEGAVTSRKYGVEQVPSFILIDKNGNPSGEVFGGIDPKYDVSVSIAKAIDKLL